MSRGRTRAAPGNKVLLILDETTNQKLLAARDRSGRTKTNEVFISKRLVRTVLIFTESSDQLSRATDRVPGLPASPGYVQ
ncbi:TraY domain-containing protein [Escherichia coli]|nr:TraY domain-containing protein [Escherichia coli]